MADPSISGGESIMPDTPSADHAPPQAPPPTAGRNDRGRFAVGNILGPRFQPGNEGGRLHRISDWRAVILETVPPDRLALLVEEMYQAALRHDWDAAKLLLAYCAGRPATVLDHEREANPPKKR